MFRSTQCRIDPDGTDGKASVKAAVPRAAKVISTATTKAEVVETSRSPRNKGRHAVLSAPCASEVTQSKRLGKARPTRNAAKHGSAIADPVGTAVMTSKMKTVLPVLFENIRFLA